MMNRTRSFGTQCNSKRSTGVQTKRLSKDEIRYYTKIIDKEKEVLLKFMQATKERVQPRHKVNLLSPIQKELPRNNEPKRKAKRKNKRRHSSVKIKTLRNTQESNENVENRAHYVSKIVVDDNTQSLKLSFKPCNTKKPKSVNVSKENDRADKNNERARSRKLKRPRRVYRTPEYHPQSPTTPKSNENVVKNNENVVKNTTKSPEVEQETEVTVHPLQLHSASTKPQSPKLHLKQEPMETPECEVMLKITGSDVTLNPRKAALNQLKERKHSQHDLNSSYDDETSKFHDSSFAKSDDEQSNCSEEFSIMEPREVVENTKSSDDVTLTNDTETKSLNYDDGGTESANTTSDILRSEMMKSELKKRLKANLIRRQIDNQHLNTNNNKKDLHTSDPGNEPRTEENGCLPQVVSVHFYDPQSHCQRVIDPNTHITQYERRDGTHLMLDDPTPPASSLSPPVRSASITSPGSFTYLRNTPSQSPPGHIPPPGLAPVVQTTAASISYHYPPHTQHVNRIPQQPPVVTYANHVNNFPSTNEAPIQSPIASYPPPHRTDVRSSPPATNTTSSTTSTSIPSSTISVTQTVNSQNNEEKKVNEKLSEPCVNSAQLRCAKRQRFIFGADEPPRKKVISSLLTPLCEREAVRLADGIHEINMQYFPLRSLAQKAANRASEDTDDVLKLIDQKIQLKTKVQDVEKARNLLKDIYDMVLKSKEIEDIQNFELVSHNFGVRNILNHLSLVDLYFGELGTELQSKI